MDKKDKKRRRSIRILSQIPEKTEIENALINNFEATYGSTWKDLSPNYISTRRKSVSRRRSGIYNPVPMLEEGMAPSDLSVCLVPRITSPDLVPRITSPDAPNIDSPELSRAPDNLSANNSLNVNASAMTPEISQHEDTSVDVHTPNVRLSEETADESNAVKTDFESPEYPEGIFIGQNNHCNNFQSPVLSRPDSVKENSFSTPCAALKLNDSIAYSPSQPIFSPTSVNLHKSYSEKLSPHETIFKPDIDQSALSPSDSDLSEPNIPKQIVQKQFSSRKNSTKKQRQKIDLENCLERKELEKKETSRFFSICKTLASKIANVVRKSPESVNDKPSDNTIQEIVTNLDNIPPNSEETLQSDLHIDCEAKLELNVDDKNGVNNCDNQGIGGESMHGNDITSSWTGDKEIGGESMHGNDITSSWTGDKEIGGESMHGNDITSSWTGNQEIGGESMHGNDITSTWLKSEADIKLHKTDTNSNNNHAYNDYTVIKLHNEQVTTDQLDSKNNQKLQVTTDQLDSKNNQKLQVSTDQLDSKNNQKLQVSTDQLDSKNNQKLQVSTDQLDSKNNQKLLVSTDQLDSKNNQKLQVSTDQLDSKNNQKFCVENIQTVQASLKEHEAQHICQTLGHTLENKIDHADINPHHLNLVNKENKSHPLVKSSDNKLCLDGVKNNAIVKKRGRPRRKSIDPKLLVSDKNTNNSEKKMAEYDSNVLLADGEDGSLEENSQNDQTSRECVPMMMNVELSGRKQNVNSCILESKNSKHIPGIKNMKEQPVNSQITGESSSDSDIITSNFENKLLQNSDEIFHTNINKVSMVTEESNILMSHIDSADFDQIQEFLSMNEEKIEPVATKKRSKRRSADTIVLSDILQKNNSYDNEERDIPLRRNTRMRRRSIEIYQAGENYKNKELKNISESPSSVDEDESPQLLASSMTKSTRKRKRKEENVEDIYRNKNYKAPDERVWETIYECPGQTKNPDQLLGKKRFKRAIIFETVLPSKLKRRTKRAAENGWDAKRRKKLHLPDEVVIEKLAELDNLLKVD